MTADGDGTSVYLLNQHNNPELRKSSGRPRIPRFNIQRDYNAQFYEKNKECFIYFKIPLFIKYHHLEQGDGTALEGNALTADISRADVVLHRAGLTGGRSAKRRTSSVPLGQLVPL